MKKKISLNDLKVASFVTTGNFDTIKGGVTDPRLSKEWDCPTDYTTREDSFDVEG
ncbi:pinensin family lanthipeptide [Roseivirga sp. BDSF3-8]|uniref:pinensin family lanthipeptide n=1 Tax=Roseivirga sp. BDSF3-8 TaxID=3241598 RepID=UPI003531B42B